MYIYLFVMLKQLKFLVSASDMKEKLIVLINSVYRIIIPLRRRKNKTENVLMRYAVKIEHSVIISHIWGNYNFELKKYFIV